MIVDGAVNIRDLESQYHIPLPRDEGFETLAGFVLSHLQKIPQVGNSFAYDGRRYTVASMDGLRVESVKVEIAPPPQQAQSSPATPVTR
ncbi:MAG: transporter associated domain-containing protein, partial [Candidatus Korobacteraceae bacterium]